MLQGVEWKYFDEVRVRECVSAYVIHTNNHSDALPEEDLQDQARLRVVASSWISQCDKPCRFERWVVLSASFSAFGLLVL